MAAGGVFRKVAVINVRIEHGSRSAPKVGGNPVPINVVALVVILGTHSRRPVTRTGTVKPNVDHLSNDSDFYWHYAKSSQLANLFYLVIALTLFLPN